MSLPAHPTRWTTPWAPLEAELDLWAAAGRTARFWWRDDDAIAPSHALDQLYRARGSAPLALAVIPDGVQAALAASVAALPGICVLQHGIAHTNHALPPAKKTELSDQMPHAPLIAALAEARQRLATLFGPRFRAVLVPPWNRIACALVPLLPGAGFVGLSAAGAYPGTPTPGLRQVNCHIDPIAWRGDRRCRPLADLVGETVRHLSDRRQGGREDAEPIGLLTHHRLEDASALSFAADLARLVSDHPASRWIDAGHIWPA